MAKERRERFLGSAHAPSVTHGDPRVAQLAAALKTRGPDLLTRLIGLTRVSSCLSCRDLWPPGVTAMNIFGSDNVTLETYWIDFQRQNLQVHLFRCFRTFIYLE